MWRAGIRCIYPYYYKADKRELNDESENMATFGIFDLSLVTDPLYESQDKQRLMFSGQITVVLGSLT